MAGSVEQAGWQEGARGRFETEVGVRERGGDTSPRRPHEEALTYQERFGDLLDGLGLLPHGDRQRAQAHRSTAELAADCLQHAPVQPVETELVNLVQLQGLESQRVGHDAVAPHLRHVPYASQEAVRDAWRAPRARRDELCGSAFDRYVEALSRSVDDVR